MGRDADDQNNNSNQVMRREELNSGRDATSGEGSSRDGAGKRRHRDKPLKQSSHYLEVIRDDSEERHVV